MFYPKQSHPSQSCHVLEEKVYVYQCLCMVFVHACALPMSLATTCDLGKGKFSVLMWQLMPFLPLQMALIVHGMAQGQLLGVTVRERERETM